jgi:hypothetical protein
MSTQQIPPSFALFRMVTGYYVSRAIYVVAKLGIADHLSEGPRRVDDLAAATGAHASSLKRVLCRASPAGARWRGADGRSRSPARFSGRVARLDEANATERDKIVLGEMMFENPVAVDRPSSSESLIEPL